MASDPRLLLQKADKAAQVLPAASVSSGGRQENGRMQQRSLSTGRQCIQNYEAGQAFEKAADILQSKLSEPDAMANVLTEAFKTYRKDSPTTPPLCLDRGHPTLHFQKNSNFRRAATHQQNLAEVYENEIGDQKKALEAYDVAAGWFESDNAERTSKQTVSKSRRPSPPPEGDYKPAGSTKFQKPSAKSLPEQQA
ncbi:hypothetical protein ABVK25_012504 [Lepraria finkii]|uniref:Uncharacterized protein n=1 Tax=Lepraria finkii TaxID=1340010 RepID=A0ABR4AEY7_9LECA